MNSSKTKAIIAVKYRRKKLKRRFASSIFFIIQAMLLKKLHIVVIEVSWMSLCLCMIVKNEEDNLPRCLESVKDIVDEMVIVDTGSTDSTIDIAKRYGATVYEFPWNGSFSDARNHSLKHAGCDWILMMDADEEMDRSSHAAVKAIVEDKDNDTDAYYGESICYAGDTQGFDTILNLNLRLVRNGKGYFFTQPIHEQLWSNIYEKNPNAKVLEADIKVYHYGYLKKDMLTHKKQDRNMEILKKQLEDDPDNAFINFNLANEYNICGDNLKAIYYYEKAYKFCSPKHGFTSKLLLRMTACHMSLGQMEDAIRIAAEGLIYYPDFTDLELMIGVINTNMRRYTVAIRQFERCIDMGEASCNLRVIGGAGTYKACHFLADIYCDLEDYAKSEEWCKKALGFKKDYVPAFNRLLKVYCSMELGQKALAASIEKMRYLGYDDFDSIVYVNLMSEKYFNLAITYIGKFEKKHGSTPISIFSKGMCYMYLRKYKKAYNIMNQVRKYPDFLSRGVCIQALCKIIENDVDSAFGLLSNEYFKDTDGLVTIYREFARYIEDGQIRVISEDEIESSVYLIAIMDLLTILLRTHELELFEKALNLFNTINDKTVLLRLAKLYYNEKCYTLAYKEFLHSIKEFDLIDKEGIKMLSKIR